MTLFLSPLMGKILLSFVRLCKFIITTLILIPVNFTNAFNSTAGFAGGTIDTECKYFIFLFFTYLLICYSWNLLYCVRIL